MNGFLYNDSTRIHKDLEIKNVNNHTGGGNP